MKSYFRSLFLFFLAKHEVLSLHILLAPPGVLGVWSTTLVLCLPFEHIQWNLINMNSRNNVHISRNFTLTVASCISVIIPQSGLY